MNTELRLRIPGPTPVPHQINRAMSQPMISHRGSEFKKIWHEVTEGLQYIFQTKNDCFILTGSGTSAMEAAVANMVSPGTSALAVVSGKFGERWANLLKAYQADVHVLNVEWGQSVKPAVLAAAIAESKAEVVYLTQNESSTAVLHDIEACAKVCKEAGALVVVDTVSSLGGIPFLTDEWGIDIAVTGSQKCLMLPPGLAFMAVSEAAMKRAVTSKSPKFYFDLNKYKKSNASDEAPYTPAVSLVLGLQESLRLVKEEGLEASWKRHKLMQQMTRKGLEALGLKLMVDEQDASPTVTAVCAPDGIDINAWRKELSKRTGVVVSGGQDHLDGRIFRIGHMGYCTPLEVLTTLAAIEVAFAGMNYPIQRGAAVAAAEEVWLQWK